MASWSRTPTSWLTPGALPQEAGEFEELPRLVLGFERRAVGRLRMLIDELNALAVHPALTYEQRWTPGELIVWDNRCLMHRATEYDPAVQRRVVRRCTVLGEAPRP